MRRADRLFMIVDLLRPARLMTAQALAQRLEVSVRTIYRDVADLIGAGVPITSEAGAGYLMRAGYDLPPLMLTRAEAAALMAGARMLHAYGGHDMGRAAREAMDKITAVLPADMAQSTSNLPFFVPQTQGPSATTRALCDQMEQAIAGRSRLHIRYINLSGADSTRWIEPAALFFWGDVWTLGAYCQLRAEVRMFRVDRCNILAVGENFSPARAAELARSITLRHQSEARRL